MLHSTPVRAAPRRSLMNRRRVQLVGALLIGALLPYLLRAYITEGTESLTKWIHFWNRLEKLEALGMGGLATKLFDGSIEPTVAEDRFNMAYYEHIMREVFRVCPALAEFNGQSHEQLVASFRECDQQRIAMARFEVAIAHHAKIPQD